MFSLARIKLTAWYLLIIMMVSGLFSMVIYQGVTGGLEQGFRRAEVRISLEEETIVMKPGRQLANQMLINDFEEAKRSLQFRLLVANGVILLLSAVASYVLAGTTLRPLEQALDQQRRFIADASHEMRTPITALKTCMEVEIRDKKVSKQTKQLLAEFLEDINELELLSTRLLDLTALESGVKTVWLSADQIRDELERAIKTVSPLAKQHKIRLITNLQNGQFSIRTNPGSIEQLATILMDNAIKYTESKGQVELVLIKHRSQLSIKVKDTGIGIKSEDLPHIFERFYQVTDARTRSESRGFGLGLSLAQQIAQAHGGSISVNSKVGEGTTFVVYLPLV